MTISLKYWNGTAWSVAQDYNALYFESEIETFRDTGLTLNHHQYSHLLSYRYTHQLSISADELVDGTKLLFLMNYYIAQGWKYSLDAWISETEVVLMDSGKLPKELIEGNLLLPEITLVFVDKEPSQGELT